MSKIVLPISHVRRQDRAVNDESWIRQLLHTAPYGSLATSIDGQPFVNSNLFVYDEGRHAIYLHTARIGRTRSNIESAERVCFSVSQMGRLLPAAEALEFSVEYAGVAIFGRAQVVDDDSEAEHGLQLLLDKYAPHLRPDVDYRSITPQELKRTAVFRIDIDEWSGKKKEVGDDFPGAYHFDQLDEGQVEEHHREGLLISTDRRKLDIDLIYQFLANEAYWSSGVTKGKVMRQMKHALCFGLYTETDKRRQQIGFARAVTDYTNFAHVADVFILEPYRGRGLGTWLMQSVLAHAELQGIKEWSLNTRDAHGFYRQFGFDSPSSQEYRMSMRPGQEQR